MKPVEDASSFWATLAAETAGRPAGKDGGGFSDVLAGLQRSGASIPRPSSGPERNLLWNWIARERPELLESDVPQGISGRENQERANDIRDKLMGAGLDRQTAVFIASREASTRVRRTDGSVPGPGASGYMSMPDSVNSERVSANPQAREGIGWAYVDRYGFSHVTKNLATALNFSGNGEVYKYNGLFGGGYPLDANKERAILDLPQVRMYANAERRAREEAEARGHNPEQALASRLPGPPAGSVNPHPLTEDYILQYAENARRNPLMDESS